MLVEMRFRLAELFRPIMTRLPRGSAFLYHLLLTPGRSGTLKDVDVFLKKKLRRRHRVFYDRYIPAYVLADLGDWECRAHYFMGRHYGSAMMLLIRSCLSQGGTFVDVGANRGIFSLCAAQVLRGRGQVHAFEPNPEAFGILNEHVAINHVGNCTSYNVGISDEPGTLNLNLFQDDHSGSCSFLEVRQVKQTFAVPVHTLEALSNNFGSSGRTLVKIDTEGFDHKVIRGMGKLLDRDGLVIACEIIDRFLRLAGSSAEELFEEMFSRGFSAYRPGVRFRDWVRQDLVLERIPGPQNASAYDVVFAKPGSLDDILNSSGSREPGNHEAGPTAGA